MLSRRELSQVSTLRCSYDSESDSGDIQIGECDVARTESLTASLHVDRDGSDNIVGIEALTVTDPSRVPHVTDLLAGRVSDASLVSARLRDMVATSDQGSQASDSTATADSLAGGSTRDTQWPESRATGADQTAPADDYPAHSYGRAITARPERRAWTML